MPARPRPHELLDGTARIAFGLWIGAVAGVAFVAAPLVFGAVPEHIATKDSAARVIGPAFARVDIFGLVACALTGIALLLRREDGAARWRLLLIAVVAICAAVDAFFLAPKITAREEPLRIYHGLATTAWMLILLFGALLLAVGLLPRPSEASRDPS
ncbi:MAG: DUF4149 domain-containing protein [Planctomycetota bacterium]|nr:DUF4149 domain-containing protein [Planctomycetota bacterium]